MKFMTMKHRPILLALASLSWLFVEEVGAQGNPDRPENYAIVKSIMESEGTAASQEQFREMGDAVVPALAVLFTESKDELYRAWMVRVALHIDGNRDPMIQAIKSELAKDPGEWHGTYWIFSAFEGLYYSDPEAARWVAQRTLALEAGRSSQAHLQAARVLKEWGQPEDIPALERTISARQVFVDEVARQIEMNELPLGAFDGISKVAAEAIIEIRAREAAGDGADNAWRQPNASSDEPGSSPSAVLSDSEGPATAKNASSDRTLWSVIAAVVVLIVGSAVMIRRRQ